jgi:type IV secretory pathway TraG/TraD family ATPase VirD4
METIIMNSLLYMVSVAIILLLSRFRYGFIVNILLLAAISLFKALQLPRDAFLVFTMLYILPMAFTVLVGFALLRRENQPQADDAFTVRIPTKKGSLKLQNIRRGISIIGAAGSGKTRSVVYPLLQHFSRNNFCGVIHDYKDFEITQMAKPLFIKSRMPFYTIAFDPVIHRVNPVAPRYLPDEESVNEVSRVLMENLLEIKENGHTGTTRFFNDAVEGLVGGMLWRLKTDFQEYCTLPHLIALYQQSSTQQLKTFLEADPTSRAMADAFLSGLDSDRQTAGVKSTLANALKKITTRRIFYVLSEDEVPLDVNHKDHTAVVSIVNNPRIETSLSPIIATIMHTLTRQMSVRNRRPSFLLMEEAPTIRLLNMHRIPATLRSYDIATVYVMQDKIQNDLMYGDKASRAILSNLSYQFFGKANDPDTAKYYERFFEIVKKETYSINRGHNLNFDTRITKGERELPKTRADAFFGLKPGEFVVFADGEDRRVQFKLETPRQLVFERGGNIDLEEVFHRVFREALGIIG